MNKLLAIPFTIIFFISTIKTLAQTKVEKELDSITLKMFKDTNERDYDALMDMTHPKLFDLVPKDAMIQVIKSMFEGTEDFKVDLPKKIPEYKISSVFKDEENNSEFAFVSYDLDMTMTFHKQSFDEEAKKMMINMMEVKGMYVKFTSDKSMEVFMPNRITILIKDKSTKNKWAMLNYDPESPLFFQILSKPVLEKTKAYYEDLMIENKKN